MNNKCESVIKRRKSETGLNSKKIQYSLAHLPLHERGLILRWVRFLRILPEGYISQSAYSRVLRVSLKYIHRDWVNPMVSLLLRQGGAKVILFIGQWVEDCLKSECRPVIGWI